MDIIQYLLNFQISLMKKITGSAITLLLLTLPFWLVGLTYEQAYFYSLGLDSSDYLNYLHYVVSGFFKLLFIPTILILSLFFKALSKNVARDDWAHVKAQWDTTSFDEHVKVARVGFFISFTFMILVMIEPFISLYKFQIGISLYFVAWSVMGLFFPSFYSGTKDARLSLSILFILSMIFIFIAGGLEMGRTNLARIDNEKNNYVELRNDMVTKITYSDGKYSVTVNPLLKTTLLKIQSLITKITSE